jgi:quercetin dioxygenase-like cupin family protein
MKIINIKDAEARDVEGGNPLFFGGKVSTQFLLDEEHHAQKIVIVNVRFTPGARNKFHSHSGEQILYVTEGKGIIATRDKEYELAPGMLAYVPPNEVHWHGATKDSSFAHLSIIGQPDELKIVEK